MNIWPYSHQAHDCCRRLHRALGVGCGHREQLRCGSQCSLDSVVTCHLLGFRAWGCAVQRACSEPGIRLASACAVDNEAPLRTQSSPARFSTVTQPNRLSYGSSLRERAMPCCCMLVVPVAVSKARNTAQACNWLTLGAAPQLIVLSSPFDQVHLYDINTVLSHSSTQAGQGFRVYRQQRGAAPFLMLDTCANISITSVRAPVTNTPGCRAGAQQAKERQRRGAFMLGVSIYTRGCA